MFGFYNWVRGNSLNFPNKLAVITDDQRITYQDLAQLVNKLAFGLSKKGVSKGTKLAILISNDLEFVLCFLAAFKLGATLFPLNFRLVLDEIVDIVSAAECQFFVCGRGFLGIADALSKECPDLKIVVSDSVSDSDESQSLIEFSSLLDNDQENWEYFADLDPDDEILAIFTGGTTGKSKAAMHTQQSLLCQIIPRLYGGGEISGLGHDEVYLLHAPLFHLSGISALTGMLATANTIILKRKFCLQDALQTIEEEKVTQMILAPPSLANQFTGMDDFSDHDLSSVRTVRIGGSNSTPQQIEQIFQVFPGAKVLQVYGMSEFIAHITMFLDRETLATRPELAGALGPAVYFTEARLFDSQHNEVPVGEPGELWARSWGGMRRYLSQEATDIDGFRPTGDIMRQDADGLFYFLGRTKDMVNSGGENIYPTEVEEVIRLYPGISDCCVVGLPDPNLGEMVVAALILKPDAVLDEGLLMFCKEHMASYKKPRKLFVVDDYPRTNVGKIDKAKLVLELQQKSEA